MQRMITGTQIEEMNSEEIRNLRTFDSRRIIQIEFVRVGEIHDVIDGIATKIRAVSLYLVEFRSYIKDLR